MILNWSNMTFYCGLLHTTIGRPTTIYIHQLCIDTGCSLVDLPRAMTDRDERIKLLILFTPPLGQDMTQGQFLSGGLNSEFSFS